MKREQMIEGIIKVNRIPKMIDRLIGVSSPIFLCLLFRMREESAHRITFYNLSLVKAA